MKKKKLTPMLEQYFRIKEKHPENFLFFRLGDFYELFGEDAKEASKLLGLTLTARMKGSEHEIAMCGIPHHSAKGYIAQLTSLGKRVSICDQVSDPSLPGIVKREVTRIITPGTTLDESVTDISRNNYILSLLQEKSLIGLSILDLGTGEFRVTEISEQSVLKNLIFLLSPSEIISNDREQMSETLPRYSSSIIEYQMPYYEDPQCFLQRHFQVSTLSGFGIEHMSLGISAAAALLSYVKETQKTGLEHIRKITSYRFQDIMNLDESTIRNLELIQTARDGNIQGSLISILDKTLTRMGARKIRQWLLYPLTNKERIDRRLNAVEDFMNSLEKHEDVRRELKDFFDLERLVARIGCKTVNARDLNYLKINLVKIPALKTSLQDFSSPLLNQLKEDLRPLESLITILDKSISPEAPISITEGGIIADGYDEKLDRLRTMLNNGKNWLIEYQKKLREETEIPSLKVKYNKVFGYYIEVSKVQSKKMPESFDLKQTLLNTYRYMSSELKEFEESYLSAEEKIKTLEYDFFQKIVEEVIPFIGPIQRNAELVAILDVIQGLSKLAIEEGYCKPHISEEIGVEIRDGRHPVIENLLKKNNQVYVANDCLMNKNSQIIVLTGPNMAGKSSYLRQVALIVLMSHVGSFVPASSARICLTDRIFTRVGASDDISSGQSTFMVEMTEAANIINNASERSLIIFDELGRGTSTYDGVSIAWAILEYIARDVKALTLFATHYHELIDMATEIPQAKNYSIAVSEKDGEVIFLRKIVDKGVDRSYGIEVAKLAGIPGQIIRRAKQILQEFEKERFEEEQSLMGVKPSLFSINQNLVTDHEPAPHRKILDSLERSDPDQMTPMDALIFISDLKKSLK